MLNIAVDLVAILVQLSAVAFYPVFITIWDEDDVWDDEVHTLVKYFVDNKNLYRNSFA